jgi:hypothetical protein
LQADYGVLMGSRKTAAEVLRAYNVEVRYGKMLMMLVRAWPAFLLMFHFLATTRPLASFETKFAQEPNAQGTHQPKGSTHLRPLSHARGLLGAGPVVWQANDWGEVVSWLFPSDENRK